MVIFAVSATLRSIYPYIHPSIHLTLSQSDNGPLLTDFFSSKTVSLEQPNPKHCHLLVLFKFQMTFHICYLYMWIDFLHFLFYIFFFKFFSCSFLCIFVVFFQISLFPLIICHKLCLLIIIHQNILLIHKHKNIILSWCSQQMCLQNQCSF